MKSGRRLALAALFALASLLPLSPPSPSWSPVAGAHAATATRSPAGRIATPVRWWGAVGAITCGIALKYVLTAGPQPAVVSVALSACTLALLDVVTTEE